MHKRMTFFNVKMEVNLYKYPVKELVNTFKIIFKIIQEHDKAVVIAQFKGENNREAPIEVGKNPAPSNDWYDTFIVSNQTWSGDFTTLV